MYTTISFRQETKSLYSPWPITTIDSNVHIFSLRIFDLLTTPGLYYLTFCRRLVFRPKKDLVIFISLYVISDFPPSQSNTAGVIYDPDLSPNLIPLKFIRFTYEECLEKVFGPARLGT